MTDTIIMDTNENRLAVLPDAIFPTLGSVVSFGDPNRDAIVLDVRLMVEKPFHEMDSETGYGHGFVRVKVSEPGALIHDDPPSL